MASKKIFGDLMRQAQEIQGRIEKVQQELARKTVEATSGGGMVTAVANGRQQILAIRIDPELVKAPDSGTVQIDLEMLQDLVTAAVNEALKKAQAMAAEEMRAATGGLGIPGIL